MRILFIPIFLVAFMPARTYAAAAHSKTSFVDVNFEKRGRPMKTISDTRPHGSVVAPPCQIQNGAPPQKVRCYFEKAGKLEKIKAAKAAAARNAYEDTFKKGDRVFLFRADRWNLGTLGAKKGCWWTVKLDTKQIYKKVELMKLSPTGTLIKQVIHPHEKKTAELEDLVNIMKPTSPQDQIKMNPQDQTHEAVHCNRNKRVVDIENAKVKHIFKSCRRDRTLNWGYEKGNDKKYNSTCYAIEESYLKLNMSHFKKGLPWYRWRCNGEYEEMIRKNNKPTSSGKIGVVIKTPSFWNWGHKNKNEVKMRFYDTRKSSEKSKSWLGCGTPNDFIEEWVPIRDLRRVVSTDDVEWPNKPPRND